MRRRCGQQTQQEIIVPDAGHAFNADYRPSYHAESAKTAGSECWNGLQYGVKSNAIVAKSDD